MIMVHTDMDIAVEEPEIQSVSRNLIEKGPMGFPSAMSATQDRTETMQYPNTL